MALVVVALLERPRTEPPGEPRRKQQPKMGICKTHGKVVANRRGRCPKCNGELTNA